MSRSYDSAPIGESEAMAEAIRLIGGIRPLARALEIRPQAISQWRRIPPARVLTIERLSGVSRTRLRPDLYPLC